jgi:hypothetical protein
MSNMFGKSRKFHNEELCNLPSSLIISMMKLSGRRWVGHVTHMGEIKSCLENPGGREHLEI